MREARQNIFRMAGTVFSDIKEGHALVIYLEILPQHSVLNILVPFSAISCLSLCPFLIIPTCFFPTNMVNVKGGLCNASVARLLVSLI